MVDLLAGYREHELCWASWNEATLRISAEWMRRQQAPEDRTTQ
jgi:hypothetical protein